MEAMKLMMAAERSARAARVLLDAADADGACDRAFIAMYSAARAAVLHRGHELGKTHQGVIGTFTEHLVKTGLLPREMVQMLKTAENRRYQANHTDFHVDSSKAEEVVGDASTFVAAVDALISLSS